MAVACDPSDDQQVVPLETYRDSIQVLADTAALYRDERNAMQAERDEYKAQLNTALRYASELRRALRYILDASGWETGDSVVRTSEWLAMIELCRALLAEGTGHDAQEVGK